MSYEIFRLAILNEMDARRKKILPEMLKREIAFNEQISDNMETKV